MNEKGIVCDFCSSTDVRWRYKALSGRIAQVGNVIVNSLDDWAACDICSSLIETREKEELVRRSVELFPDSRLTREQTTMLVRMAHTSFWLCKFGDRIEEEVFDVETSYGRTKAN